MAIHDLNLADQYSVRIVFLRQGEVYMWGPPEEALVAENIEFAYEVEAKVSNDCGRPHIVPLGISAH